MMLLRLVLPFCIYVGLTALLDSGRDSYPYLYIVVSIITVVCTAVCFKNLHLIRPHRQCVAAVVIGILGFLIWIFLAGLSLETQLIASLPEVLKPSERPAFNPFESGLSPFWLWAFVSVRLMSLSLLVPVFEEVFWRGFVWRWLAARQWQDQPMGVYSAISFWGVLFLFVLAHPEWLAAACWCLLINLLFCWKRNLWDCILAHGVTNGLLGLYVVLTGNWSLW